MAIETIGIEEKRPYEIGLGQRNLDKGWMELEADQELVEQIKQRGFSNTCPILKATGSMCDTQYSVVEGGEILRAAKEAGLETVWCFIVTGTEEEVKEESETEEEVSTEEVETEETSKEDVKVGDLVKLVTRLDRGKIGKVVEVKRNETTSNKWEKIVIKVVYRNQSGEWGKKANKLFLPDWELVK